MKRRCYLTCGLGLQPSVQAQSPRREIPFRSRVTLLASTQVPGSVLPIKPQPPGLGRETADTVRHFARESAAEPPACEPPPPPLASCRACRHWTPVSVPSAVTANPVRTWAEEGSGRTDADQPLPNISICRGVWNSGCFRALLSFPKKLQQVGVDLLRVGGGHAMRKAGIDLQGCILQYVRGHPTGGANRHNLIVVAMHHQQGDVDLLQVFGVVGLRERLNAVVMGLDAS